MGYSRFGVGDKPETYRRQPETDWKSIGPFCLRCLR